MVKGIPHRQFGLMNRFLKVVVAVSLLGLCSAVPAPDGTSAGTPTDLPTYVDTIQSIQCVDGGKIRLSFQNQYSFMDAWDWGLPRAVLINGDVESVSCDDYKPLGAAWLTSNTANADLYQQCRTGGQCTVEFNVVKADGTFKDLLVSYLSAQNMQVATTSVSVDTPTATVDGGTQPSAPGYTVDPWQSKQWADVLNDLNPGGAGGVDPEIPSGGGGYQRWQEIANEYEKQVMEMGDPNDATQELKGASEDALKDDAEETAKDLLKSSLEANAEAFAGYFVTTFIAASLRAMLLRAAETAIGKTLVQQFVKMGIRELAAPVIGEVAAIGTGEIAGAGIAATIPVAGEIIGAAIIVFSEIEQIEDMLKTPEMNQDYQIGQFKLTGPNGKEYWVVEQGSTGAPPAYEAPTVPKQFKEPFFFVPPRMVFDPTNVGDDGALKNDPWPKIGWKSFDPQVTVASESPIGTLGKGDHGNPDATSLVPITYNPQDGNHGPQVTQKGQPQAQQPQVTNGVTPQVDQPEPNETEGNDPSQQPTTTTEEPTSYPSTLPSSQPASSTKPKCLVPTQISNFITDMSKAFPAYAYSKTFKVNEGQSNEVSFKCQLACANCSLELNHKSVIENMFAPGHVDGNIDLNIGLELTCTAGENWKDAFKKKASQPLLWGMPAYKKFKKIWQGSGPMCSDFALGYAMGLTFVPFKGKVAFGFQAHKTVSMSIPAQGDTSPQDMQGMISAWEVTVNPVKFSGFGLPSLALGLDLTADWGWGLSQDTPLLDAGFDLYPNFTMSFASRSASLSDWSELEAKECELPFQASAGEKPFVYLSAMGKDIWDTVLSPVAEMWSYTATATCFANYGNTAASTTTNPLVTSTILPTATALPYSRSNSTFTTITRTSSSSISSSSDGLDQITAWPWPDPTFIIQTDDFKNLEVSTEIEGTSIDLLSLSRYMSTTAPAAVSTSATVITSAPAVSSTISQSSVSSTSTSVSALPSVTGVFNTDASCGYGQGACAEGYNCLKVWPVEVAQSYMCGKPDLTNFETANIPTDLSPPTNNGIWACASTAVCYPTCGYLGALFDPSHWTCTNPIDNAVWQCLNDDGTATISPAAANSATQCKMTCLPGFGMNDNGECIDILTDVKNCGQVGYDCSFGYDGYYASTSACAMGMCVNLCPSGYTPFVNLCFDYNTDTFNCGGFGNQCNVANQEVCKNGGCVQCYECYGTI